MATITRFIPMAVLALSLGLPRMAGAAYSHSASAGSQLLGTSQQPLAGVTAYAHSASDGPRQDVATVSFSSDPIASIAVAAQTTNPAGETGFAASGVLSYSFEVMARPLTLVPVDFLGLYSAFQMGQDRAGQTQLSLGIQSSNAGPHSLVNFALTLTAVCSETRTCPIVNPQATDGNFIGYTTDQASASTVNGSIFGVLNLLTDASGKAGAVVQLSAAVQLHAFPGTAQGSAYIDPQLQISPAFLAANPDALLTITPGVGNAISAVPEVGSRALFLLGMLALAGTRLIRRRPMTGQLPEGGGKIRRPHTGLPAWARCQVVQA